MKILPEGWHAPTPKMLEEYVAGSLDGRGLVPADHPALQMPAELVPVEDIRSTEVQGILHRMREVAAVFAGKNRPLLGLAAPQIGESVSLMLTPAPGALENPQQGPRELVAVFNPVVNIDEDSRTRFVPHGCYSADAVFAGLWSPTASTLSGYNEHGEPLRVDEHGNPASLERQDFESVVDEHESLHLLGVRAGDIALNLGKQLDFAPPEDAEEYRAYIKAYMQDADAAGEWYQPFPREQWIAMTVTGEFALRHFL